MSIESNNNEEELVSIIILNYNGGDTLIECIDSIFNSTKENFELILIDNNASDQSHIRCKNKYDAIKIIKNNDNVGLGARNLGIEIAKGKFIILLDSDTLVQPLWISKFVESYKKHGEGLFQPKLLDATDQTIINSAGNMINLCGQAFSRGKGQKDNGQFDKFEKISYTSGACTFSTKKTIERIGGIDSLFFAYHDDVDFGWRAQLLDIPSYYEPNISIFHKGSPTLQWSSKKFYYLERNRWICLLSLYSRKTFRRILPILIIIEIGTIFYFIKNRMLIYKIKAFFSLIKISKEIEIKRKNIEKIRKVSDIDVVKNFVDGFDVTAIISDKKLSNQINYTILKLNKKIRKLIK